MSTVPINLRYRPLRLGWCVADDDWDAMRRAFRTSFCFWGGRFNPIIPVGDTERAEALVRLYRVDALVPMSDAHEVASFIARHPHLLWPFIGDEVISEAHCGRRVPRIVDLTHPIKLLHENNIRNAPNPQPLVDLYQWDQADPLADIMLCTYGQVLSHEDVGTDYLGHIRQELFGVPYIVQPGLELQPLNPSRMTISMISRAYMAEHYAIRNFRNDRGFYIGDASNFEDVATFWNLRAANVPVQFYDHAHGLRLDAIRRSWVRGEVLPGSDTHPSRIALWHRRETEIGDHKDFGDEILICGIDCYLWNGLNLKAPIMIFGKQSALGAVSTSNGRTSISFALTTKPFTDSRQDHNQHYVLSVDPGIGLFGNENETLHTPFIPALNEFYGRNIYFQYSMARAEPGSLGIITSAATDDLTLCAAGVTPLITEIFRSVGIEASPSEAGRVCSTLIRQMGGLSDCRPFRIEGVRALIEDHRPDQSFSRSDAKQRILGQGETKPLSAYQWLHIEPRAPGHGLTPGDVLGFLLDRGVFRPGLNFDCPNCRLRFWISLDDAAKNVECEYCGHAFNGARQLVDKGWAFRRSGLFGRDDHQGGGIPVALALQQLVGMRGLDRAVFTTAMKLKGAGVKIPECETDLVVVLDDDTRIQIVIGECKTRHAITAADVTNLVAIADAFPADQFDVFICFARLTPFSPEEIELLRPVNSEHRLRAILLTARELEPWFMYEETAKEFDIRETAVSFADMAIVTDRVFFQELRRSPTQ